MTPLDLWRAMDRRDRAVLVVKSALVFAAFYSIVLLFMSV